MLILPIFDKFNKKLYIVFRLGPKEMIEDLLSIYTKLKNTAEVLYESTILEEKIIEALKNYFNNNVKYKTAFIVEGVDVLIAIEKAI